MNPPNLPEEIQSYEDGTEENQDTLSPATHETDDTAGERVAEERGSSTTDVTHGAQPSSWKYQSSHPIQNILTHLDSRIHTRSKLRNMCPFSAYILS
ncbi:hypothetical protein KY284_010920 [Solanum tuberosum]|nr:hypothetical protein KY284_010920 [Solanum tuberosum]